MSFQSGYGAPQGAATTLTSEALNEALQAESRVRLHALLALGAVMGPEGRKAVASQMRLVFRQMDSALARLEA